MRPVFSENDEDDVAQFSCHIADGSSFVSVCYAHYSTSVAG